MACERFSATRRVNNSGRTRVWFVEDAERGFPLWKFAKHTTEPRNRADAEQAAAILNYGCKTLERIDYATPEEAAAILSLRDLVVTELKGGAWFTKSELWQVAHAAIGLLEKADDLADEAEEERDGTYRATLDSEQRAYARYWLEKVQEARDGLVELTAELRRMHARAAR